MELPRTVGHPASYFVERRIKLDCRGPLSIDAYSHWAYDIVVLTQSHDIRNELPTHRHIGRIIPYPVRVDALAWIGSCSLLCGCHIGEGAIVAAGTVVRGQNVAPRVMVAGNPARVVSRWDGQRWRDVDESECGYSRMLA